MKDFLEAKAKEANLNDPGDFVLSLIADAIRAQMKKELEQSLLETLDEYERGESAETTPQFWEKLRGDYLRKHSKT